MSAEMDCECIALPRSPRHADARFSPAVCSSCDHIVLVSPCHVFQVELL